MSYSVNWITFLSHLKSKNADNWACTSLTIRSQSWSDDTIINVYQNGSLAYDWIFYLVLGTATTWYDKNERDVDKINWQQIFAYLM